MIQQFLSAIQQTLWNPNSLSIKYSQWSVLDGMDLLNLLKPVNTPGNNSALPSSVL